MTSWEKMKKQTSLYNCAIRPEPSLNVYPECSGIARIVHALSQFCAVLFNSVLNKTACSCSVKLAWFSGDPSYIQYIKIKPLKPNEIHGNKFKSKTKLGMVRPACAQAGLSMLSLVSEISRVMLTSSALTPQPCLGVSMLYMYMP